MGKWAFEVQNALAQGLVAEEQDGGVTASVVATVDRNLADDTTLRQAMVDVTGSSPTVAWGQEVWLKVSVRILPSFPVSLVATGPLTLSATAYGTSNVPPP